MNPSFANMAGSTPWIHASIGTFLEGQTGAPLLGDAPESLAIRTVAPEEHSMGAGNYLRYLRSKLSAKQCALLAIAVSNQLAIEVHNVFVEALPEIVITRGWTIEHSIEPITFTYGKISNVKRPLWLLVTGHDGRRILVIVVAPTKEYLLQYASIVQSAILFLFPIGKSPGQYEKAGRAAAGVKALHHAEAVDRYAWDLGLHSYLASTSRLNDVYVIGEGDRLFGDDDDYELKLLASEDQPGFRVQTFQSSTSDRRLRVVSVRHSFWGAGAAKIAQSCCTVGKASAVIYVAKLGAISPKLRLLEPVMPSEFFLFDHGRVKNIEAPAPYIEDTDCDRFVIKRTSHVSLPTLTEESTVLLSHFRSHGIETIDNEISFIARDIQSLNSVLHANIKFSCVHIVTDCPSGTVMEHLSFTRGGKINHLLSKDDLRYRRERSRVHIIAAQAIKKRLNRSTELEIASNE